MISHEGLRAGYLGEGTEGRCLRISIVGKVFSGKN